MTRKQTPYIQTHTNVHYISVAGKPHKFATPYVVGKTSTYTCTCVHSAATIYRASIQEEAGCYSSYKRIHVARYISKCHTGLMYKQPARSA